jgi:hypothetical protein
MEVGTILPAPNQEHRLLVFVPAGLQPAERPADNMSAGRTERNVYVPILDNTRQFSSLLTRSRPMMKDVGTREKSTDAFHIIGIGLAMVSEEINFLAVRFELQASNMHHGNHQHQQCRRCR